MVDQLKPFMVTSPGHKKRFFEGKSMQMLIEHWEFLLQDVDGAVAINCERKPYMLVVVYVLLKKQIPFVFNCESVVAANQVGVKWIVENNNVVPFESNVRPRSTCPESICYFIKTSGSAGTPKAIQVPYSCIWPNIEDFRDRFGVTADDVILFSTSVLFDPSVIEMFLAMITGARILLAPDDARSNPALMKIYLMEHQPTIVQLTPVVLKLLDDECLHWLLGPDSSVRILLIGGEKFPLNTINKYRTPNNPTRIFDVYGLTEVSCWATVYEVPYGCSEVYLGDAIKGTTIEIDDENNEIILKGDRHCYILKARTSVELMSETRTGDIVKRHANGRFSIIGRNDNQGKIKGVKCFLEPLEEAIVQKIPSVTFAKLTFNDKLLALFVVSSETVSREALEKVFPPLLLPASVVYLDHVPVNNNGKVDNRHFSFILMHHRRSKIASILRKSGLTTEHQYNTCSFVHFGITSLEAAEIALYLNDSSVIREVLNPNVKVGQFMRKHFKSFLFNEIKWNQSSISTATRVSSPTLQTTDVSQPHDLQLLWGVDTRKCIDGSPLLVKVKRTTAVAVASHSGFLGLVNVATGKTLWKYNFGPKYGTTRLARFEASPVLCGELIVVGSYNNHMYSVHTSGDSFTILNCGGEIKAPVGVDKDNNCYVITYVPSLVKVDTKTNKKAWTVPLEKGSVAQPVVIDHNEMKMVVCTTISGSIEAICRMTGNLFWSKNARSPVFSSIVVDGADFFVLSVEGSLQRRSLTTGKQICCAELERVCFSKPFILDDLLLVTCKDGTLIILRREDLFIHRVYRFDGFSFVKSVFEYGEYQLGLMSTDGIMLNIRHEDLLRSDRCSATAFRLAEGEVFSLPIIQPDCLVVGSRDNWLRCWKTILHPMAVHTAGDKQEEEKCVSGGHDDRRRFRVDAAAEKETGGAKWTTGRDTDDDGLPHGYDTAWTATSSTEFAVINIDSSPESSESQSSRYSDSIGSQSEFRRDGTPTRRQASSDGREDGSGREVGGRGHGDENRETDA